MSKYPPAVKRALYARNQSGTRARINFAAIARYEAEKAIWAGTHPHSTPAQYESALRTIAKACGV